MMATVQKIARMAGAEVSPAVKARSIAPIAWFYLATPVFFVTDLLWGLNVRIIALDHLPTFKIRLLHALPRMRRTDGGASEPDGGRRRAASGVNLPLVLITIPVAYMAVLDSIRGGRDAINPLTPMVFVNLSLSTRWLGGRSAVIAPRRRPSRSSAARRSDGGCPSGTSRC